MGFLSFLSVLMMGGVAYAFWREGVFTAFTMFCNMILAGLVAFGFWEPVASQLDPMLQGGFLQGFEDAFCLILLFAITLRALRVITNLMAYTDLKFHGSVLRGWGGHRFADRLPSGRLPH